MSVSIDLPSGITGTGLLHLPNYIACLGQWLFYFSCYVDCSYGLQLRIDVNVKSRIKNDRRYLICEDQSASFSWFSEYKSEKGIIFDSLAHNFCVTLVFHFISKSRHHIWKRKVFYFPGFQEVMTSNKIIISLKFTISLQQNILTGVIQFKVLTTLPMTSFWI